MAFAATAAAQSEQNDKKNFDQRRAEMVQKRTDMIVKKYGLDEKQAAALLELNRTSMPAMRHAGPRGGARGGRGMRPEGDKKVRPDSMQTRRHARQGGMTDFRKAMEEYDQKLEKIMTPEQFKAYKEDRKLKIKN